MAASRLAGSASSSVSLEECQEWGRESGSFFLQKGPEETKHLKRGVFDLSAAEFNGCIFQITVLILFCFLIIRNMVITTTEHPHVLFEAAFPGEHVGKRKDIKPENMKRVNITTWKHTESYEEAEYHHTHL